MKYRQLTKEQFESLHQEFAQFLATQKIDAALWESIKKKKPAMALEEMDLFSDVVWDDVLTNCTHLEHFSKHTLNLFKCSETAMHRIVVTVPVTVNLLEKEGLTWLLQNTNHDTVTYLQGEKKYTAVRNTELFAMIEQGSVLADATLYTQFKSVLPA